MTLTAKQERFVREYLINTNATQAARQAGYSEKTAYSQGQRLLKHVEVLDALRSGFEKAAKDLDLSAERVLRGLFEEATRHGDGASHAARVSAWVALGKYHSLFTERIEAHVTAEVTHTDARSKLEHLIARQAPAGTAKGGAGKPH